MSLILYYDLEANEDVWVEMLPEGRVYKPVQDITQHDVEVDFYAFEHIADDDDVASITRYRGVDIGPDFATTVRVTYDCVYSDSDIEDSEWRKVGQWGVQTTIPVNARVVYMIQEEEELA